MIHHLFKLVVEIGAAVAGAIAANEATRYFTGKSALQHLSDATGPLRDEIAAWCRRNPDRQISAIVLRVISQVDNTLSGLARVKIGAFAKTKEGDVKISEQELSAEEVRKQFGGKSEILLTI